MKIVNRVEYRNFYLYSIENFNADRDLINFMILKEHDNSVLLKHLVYNSSDVFLNMATVVFTHNHILKDRYMNFMMVGLNSYDKFIDSLKNIHVKD